MHSIVYLTKKLTVKDIVNPKSFTHCSKPVGLSFFCTKEGILKNVGKTKLEPIV